MSAEIRRRDLPRVLRTTQDTLDRMSDDEKWAWLKQAIDAEHHLGAQGVL